MNQGKVIITSGNLWKDRIKLGIHFFGEHFLEKGFSVSFLSFISFLSLFSARGYDHKLKRLSMWIKGPVTENFKKNNMVLNHSILSLFHSRAKTPLLNSYWIAKNQLKFSIPSINKLSRDNLYSIFMFDCNGIGAFPHVKANYTIYRFNDIVSGSIHWLSKGHIKLHDEIMRKVDLVLAVSEPLFDHAVQQRGNSKGVYLLPNGVDIEKFLYPSVAPFDYQNISSPIAVYVGGLEHWFDWEFLSDVAKKMNNISFVIIGPGRIPSNLPPNILVLGPKPFDQLPAYLNHADLGIIPFKDIPHIKFVERPLKYYQYIASGLPVVTVSYGAMKAMAPHAILADSKEEFVRGIEKALTFTKNERNKLRQVAEEYSWKRIFEKFDDILKSEGLDLAKNL
jgi:glycosyltransferase involved in cell wall biosynthesis